jgi:formylglycine-generating enzyme required for sulfatase activity
VIKGYNDGYRRTSSVGSFAANANGLYDLGRNVWQYFCEDWFNAKKIWHSLRGASWLNNIRDDQACHSIPA